MVCRRMTAKENIRYRVKRYISERCTNGEIITDFNAINFDELLSFRMKKMKKTPNYRGKYHQLKAAWQAFKGKNVKKNRLNVGLSYNRDIGGKIVAVKNISIGGKIDANMEDTGVVAERNAAKHPTCIERRLYIKEGANQKHKRKQFRFLTGIGSFINHACELHSNALPAKGLQEDKDWLGYIVAKRDISSGEEITITYNEDEPYPCRECERKKESTRNMLQQPLQAQI